MDKSRQFLKEWPIDSTISAQHGLWHGILWTFGNNRIQRIQVWKPLQCCQWIYSCGCIFLMPVLVVAIILNMIYTILCVVCLTTTCWKNTRFRTAADHLINDQRFLFLQVCKNVGYDVQTLLLQKLSTIITQKQKKRKSTEPGTDSVNF